MVKVDRRALTQAPPSTNNSSRTARKLRPRANGNSRQALTFRSLLSRGGIPERLETVLHYADRYSLTVSSGGATSQVMRLTSLFDPDYTGVGHQPMYFDQITPLYNFYIVKRADVEIYLQMSNTSAPTPMGVGILVDNVGGTVPSSQEDPKYNWERQLGTYLPLDPAKHVFWRTSVDVPRALGFEPTVYMNDTANLAAVTTNPSSNVFLRVTAIVADNAATQAMFFQLRISYHAVFVSNPLVNPS